MLFHFNSALLIIPKSYLLLLAANASTLLPVVAVLIGGAVVAIDFSLLGWGLVLGIFMAGTLAFLLGLRLETHSE